MIYISSPGVSRFLVDVVSTPAALAQGLSGRHTLPPRQGMLFVFPYITVQSMWMPNMNFPLDIVWIDSNKTVIKIEQNATPCSNTHNCKSYGSSYPVLYAIELNAFDANRMGIQVGSQLSFSV